MSGKTVDRVVQILREAECLPEGIRPDTCWLDGSSCPYGSPGGKFQDRPEAFCNLNGNGCRKLEDDVAKEFVEFAREGVLTELEDDIDSRLSDKKESLTDMLLREVERIKQVRPNTLTEVDEQAIKLVAGIFKDLPLNIQKDVVHKDDIEKVLHH